MLKSNPWAHLSQESEKAVLTTAAYFRVYSHTVAEIVKKGVSGLKQKKRVPPFNSTYLN